MRSTARVVPCMPLLLLPLAACRPDATAPRDASSATPATTVSTAPAASVAAATSDTQPASPASVAVRRSADASLARYDGYGDLRFGMSAVQATRAWGGDLKAVPAASAPCHYLTPQWVKVPADFALMVENDRFVRYDVGTAREAAPGGGRVGMAAAEIAQRYPGVEHRPHKYVEGAEVLRVRDPTGGPGVLVFETDATGEVTAWRAGVAPQVDYVEGCS